jgi:hypothetical protein
MVWQDLSASEVAQLELLVGLARRLRIDQNVVWLDVAMGDPLLMYVLDSAQKLVHELLYERNSRGVATAALESLTVVQIPLRQRQGHEVSDQVQELLVWASLEVGCVLHEFLVGARLLDLQVLLVLLGRQGAPSRVEMVPQVNYVWVVLYLLKDGCLAVHHGLVFEDLLHGHELRRRRQCARLNTACWLTGILTHLSFTKKAYLPCRLGRRRPCP